MKKGILIVEDESIIAQHLRAALEDGGYDVSGLANSVDKALQHIEKEPPFLVILDIFLKGERTGIDLAHLLNKKNIPFVYVSANCNREVLDAAKATHPYGFIVKPFRQKDLLVTLDIALYHYEHSRQLQSEKKGGGIPAATAFDGIIGKSPLMLEVFELAKQVGPMDTSVLILARAERERRALPGPCTNFPRGGITPLSRSTAPRSRPT